MANNFINVPNWFSFENQGSNLAVADLSNSGQQDLIVLMVDNPLDRIRDCIKLVNGWI